MKETTPIGSVLYSNKTLGIEQGEFSRDSHFYEEGKEKPIERKGKKGLEVGYREPLTVGARQQVTLEDVYVVFDGDNGVTQVAKSTVIYTRREK